MIKDETIICSHCYTYTSSSCLKVDMSPLIPKLKCKNCAPNDLDLDFYISQLLTEMENYRFIVFSFNEETLFNTIYDKISQSLDSYFQEMEEGLKNMISESLWNSYKAQNETTSETFEKFQKFCKLYDMIKQTKQFDKTNYQDIVDGLTFYKQEFEYATCQGKKLIDLLIALKENKVIESLCSSEEIGKIMNYAFHYTWDVNSSDHTVKNNQLKKLQAIRNIIAKKDDNGSGSEYNGDRETLIKLLVNKNQVTEQIREENENLKKRLAALENNTHLKRAVSAEPIAVHMGHKLIDQRRIELNIKSSIPRVSKKTYTNDSSTPYI